MSNHKCFQTTSEHFLRRSYKYLVLQSWTHAARAPFSLTTCNSYHWWGELLFCTPLMNNQSVILSDNLFSLTALQQSALSVLPLECFESAIFSRLPTCNLKIFYISKCFGIRINREYGIKFILSKSSSMCPIYCSHPLFTVAEGGKAPKHDGEENITLSSRPTNALSHVRRWWSTDQTLHLLSSSSLSENAVLCQNISMCGFSPPKK